MSNWKEYDMDDYVRRRDEERKQAYEQELARRRAESAKKNKQLYGRREGESIENYKNRLRGMNFNDYQINEFINNIHPLLKGKPDV